jgi:hypothetical protein
MPSLRDIQIGFAAAVRDPRSAERFGHRVVSGTLSGPRRIQVYRNNHLAILTEALEAVYPAVRRLVGDDFFRYAARRYTASHPSHSGDIHNYGYGFSDILSAMPEATAYSYLADVARLEWAYHAVFHTELRAPLVVESLSTVYPGDYHRLRFQLQPAARLVESRFPVLRIWQVNRAPQNGDCDVRLDAGGDRLLILREDAEVAFHRLTAGEYALLRGLVEGLALADAHAVAIRVQDGFDLSRALRRYAAVGTFATWHL